MGDHVVGDGSHPLRGEVRLLLQVAMAVFVWTVGIGILNGADLVEFDHKVILSHVHAGTLGWITTSVIAASLWLFGTSASPAEARRGRQVALATVVVLPVFSFTFAFTYEEPRAIIGTVAMPVIIAAFAWVVARARHVEMTVPHLGFLAAVATSVVGAVIGVLLATKIATGWDVLPDGGTDAHPATMVVGFLIPVGMALAEWGLRGRDLPRADRLGTLQMAFPFVGGLVLMLGLLFEIDPLPPLATLIELVGVVIFVKRLWAPFRAVTWGRSGAGRYAGASAVAILANILFLNYLAGANEGDFDRVAFHQILAMDHMMFVGVITNAVFALLVIASAGRTRWGRADDIVFVAMNLGLVGFVVSLLAESIGLRQVATPILGLAILLGLAERAAALAADAPEPERIRVAPAD